MRLARAKIHFIGVGGIGMCGLAELLHNMGAKVSGSDLGENEQTRRLQSLGVTIFRGHRPEHLGAAEVVVYSSAVRSDNPEYQEARRCKIPLIRRAEALAEIMGLKRGIAIAGSHGKTTTTSMTASIFLTAKMDPTIVVGGRLDLIKSTAQLGQGEWFIAEADESDGSFTRLSPEIAIITNIDNDHLDHYGSFLQLQTAFVDFSSRIPFYGCLILCGDDPATRQLFSNYGKKLITYGLQKDNDVCIQRQGDVWHLLRGEQRLGELRLPIPGVHNALNATAAVLAGLEAGVSFANCALGIAQFHGVERRFQHKGTFGGIEYYDDYGHHPTEIVAVLAALRERFPQRRLVTIFQPHRYTRTQLCWEQFCHCFKQTDQLFLLDVYAAGEAPIAGIDSQRLIGQMDHPSAQYHDRNKDPELKSIALSLRAGDVCLTLGAGDVNRLGEKMMQQMAQGIWK